MNFPEIIRKNRDDGWMDPEKETPCEGQGCPQKCILGCQVQRSLD